MSDAIYLLTIQCGSCEEESVLPSEGGWVGIMQEAPKPDAEHCPQCGEKLPGDLGAIIVEDRVAAPVQYPEAWFEADRPASEVPQ